MPGLKILLFFFVLITSSLLCNAQKYNFKNFSVNEGLSQSEIYSICEDRRGNLWFGSAGGGLIRFDGYTFVNYREEDGLINNYVRTILEDHSGNLWIGTEKGACLYNGKKFIPLDNRTGPGRETIKAIIEDSEHNVWFGTENTGLYKYRNNRFEKFTTATGLPDNSINYLFLSEDNELWIGTNNGVTKFRNHKLINYDSNDGLIQGPIRSITGDQKGNVWFASGSSGVSCYNGSSFSNYSESSGLSSNRVYSVKCDNKGQIWFGTANGLSKWDGKTFQNYYDSNGLGSNVILNISEDSSHDLWFGTSGGGVSRLDNTRFIHFTENEKMGRQVFSIVQALNGKMLFATSLGGLTFFDGANYSLLKGPDDFTSSRVKALYYDREDNLWLGTLSDGTFKFNTEGFQRKLTVDSLVGKSIIGFAMDTAKNMWFASEDSGICIINRNGVSKGFNITDGLLSNNIYAIVPDKKGNVWVGTDKGLNRLSVYGADSILVELSSYTSINGLNNQAIRCIAADRSDDIFIGTAGGGIYVLKDAHFINIDKRSGLSSNNVYSLIFDNQNHLWVGSEMGVDRLRFGSNFKVADFRHFGKSEGFTGMEVLRNSCFKDREGRIWFGTINGATVYDPSEDVPFLSPPITHITGIKLFFDDIEKTKYVDSVSAWYPIPRSLVLPYNKNSLTFSFAGIYHRNPQAVRYRWKLEGLSNDWSPALPKQDVNYSNLRPGRYIFKVMSCNEYNVWNKNPITFEFRILPPVWQRWWFILIVTALVMGSVLLYFNNRVEKIKEKSRIERERLQMEKHMVELEQEASRLQMNPHFIFNALNSIQGFISTNDAVQAKKYLTKFGRLMRLILENAREKYIPLQNEIEMLKNYLELEQLCKNNKFDFKIEMDPDIESDNVEVPPMMIQPFVENAIIHGIKNMDGRGLIELKFHLLDSVLICEVIDNGIGRKKAAEIKNKMNSNHKSTAMIVTKKRLEQLGMDAGKTAGFEIEDLADSHQFSSGTKVTITIPVES